MRIILVGASGKMGKAITQIAKDNNIQIIAKIDKNNSKYKDFNKIPPKVIKNADVVLDFSLPNVLEDELDFCLKNNKKLVICCTGHTKQQEQKIFLASKKITIIKTANTSLGVALINKILNDYSKILKDYKISILEKHHINKKDAPSGTAVKFLNTLKSKNLDSSCISIRAGTCIGEHQVLMFGNYEQITIIHNAESRSLFAESALKICEYAKKLNSGLYDMDNYINDLIRL